MKRGFSLLEALVTSFLVLVMLGVIGGVIQGYMRAQAVTEAKDRNWEAVVNSLRSVRNDCQAAVAFLQPLPTDLAVSPRLDLQRFSPAATRLPAVLPTPLPASWDPMPATELITIRYEVTPEEVLTRTLLVPAGESFRLAQETTGFSVQHVDTSLLEVAFSIQDRGRTLALRTRIHLPMGRR